VALKSELGVFSSRVVSRKALLGIIEHQIGIAGAECSSMRKLIVSTFASLDGIVQSPGKPEEDPTGEFALGSWTTSYWDESMDITAAGFDAKDRELVLGRRTYQIFEAYWPYQPADHPIAALLNAAKKYVASRTLKVLEWNNSTLFKGDVVSALTALKAQAGPDLQIIGSGNLIQTLQAAALIDEYNVWTFPVVLGSGKRLFTETAKPSALRLVRSQVSTTGVVMSTYVPDGDIPLTLASGAETNETELTRRKKIADGVW
jgi:dihydrofolate reductase